MQVADFKMMMMNANAKVMNAKRALIVSPFTAHARRATASERALHCVAVVRTRFLVSLLMLCAGAGPSRRPRRARGCQTAPRSRHSRTCRPGALGVGRRRLCRALNRGVGSVVALFIPVVCL